MSGQEDDATDPGYDDAGLTDDQVTAYLRRHPDFLARHPEAAEALVPPDRWSGDGIVDFQQVMLSRLRNEIQSLRDCAANLIDTSRSNMSNQTRTHAAVLALLGTADFAQTVRIIREDLTLLLSVDAVTVGFEPPAVPLTGLAVADVQRLGEGAVDRLLGTGQDVALLTDVEDDGTIFDAAAGIVRSAALARIRPGTRVPVGLLALGTRTSATFQPGQGTELVGFLALVVERCVHRWLDSPA